MQAMAFCGEQEARRILSLSRPAYAALKQDIARTFAGILEAVCPPVGGEEKLRLLDVWTPATYRRFVGTETGSFMSFPMLPGDGFRNGAAELAERLLSGRLPVAPAGTVSGIENVLLAGQWLRAPAGCLLPPGRDAVRRARRNGFCCGQGGYRFVLPVRRRREADKKRGRKPKMSFLPPLRSVSRYVTSPA